MLPILLALNSAVLFAIGIQLTQIGLRHTDPETATLITIGAATGLYWLLAPFYVEAHFWLSAATPIFAAIGLFRPVVSAHLAMAGTFHLGPTLSSTLSSTAPMFGLALGVLALGERLSASVLLGTCTIVAGVVVISWRGGASFGWPVWALMLPVGAAALRSLAHMLAKVGMLELPSPFFAGLVSYTVSFAVALAYSYRPGGGAGAAATLPGLGWLGTAGLLYGLSVLSLNGALQHGALVVVSPILACSPLFTLLFGVFLFRQETINRRVVSAVVLVVTGVVLVAAR